MVLNGVKRPCCVPLSSTPWQIPEQCVYGTGLIPGPSGPLGTPQKPSKNAEHLSAEEVSWLWAICEDNGHMVQGNDIFSMILAADMLGFLGIKES